MLVTCQVTMAKLHRAWALFSLILIDTPWCAIKICIVDGDKYRLLPYYEIFSHQYMIISLAFSSYLRR